MRFQVHNHQDASTSDYEFHLPEVCVGTSSTNDIVLYQTTLSGRHLKFLLDCDPIEVMDLESRSGTFINGERIEGKRAINEDDVISLGSYSLRFFSEEKKKKTAKVSEETLYWNVLHSGERDRYDESLIPVKQEIHRRLIAFLDLRRMDLNNLDPQELHSTTSRAVWSIVEAMGDMIPDDLDNETLHKEIIDEVLGFGPIEDLIRDPEITEIMVNNKSQIFVEIRGKLYLTNRSFSSDESLHGIIERIVSPLGRRIDESSPMVDARLKDGSRVNAIVPPLSLKGPVLTIRKFSREPFTMDRLIQNLTVTSEVVEFLETAVKHRNNIVISGGTSSGKTTLLNTLCAFLPSHERIITVEDSAELRLPQEHLISLEGRPPNIQGKGEVTIRELVRNCLRMRPDRIVVGEVRGGEALDMLQAMNTGHDGSMTTGHANSPHDFLRRLETMVMMAGVELPVRAIREQISSAINIIVQMIRFSDGTRRVVNVSEVERNLDPEGSYGINELFVFQQSGIGEGGKVLGNMMPSGRIPYCYEVLEKNNIEVNKAIFRPHNNEEGALPQ